MFHFSALPHYAIYRNTLGIALSVLLYFKTRYASRGYAGFRVKFVTKCVFLKKTELRFTYLEIKQIHKSICFSEILIKKRKTIMEIN